MTNVDVSRVALAAASFEAIWHLGCIPTHFEDIDEAPNGDGEVGPARRWPVGAGIARRGSKTRSNPTSRYAETRSGCQYDDDDAITTP